MTNTNAVAQMDEVNTAHERLRTLFQRIERLEEEKAGLGEDIKEIYAEAKADGYDVTAMKKLVALRKKDPQQVAELEEVMDLYKHALGMI